MAELERARWQVERAYAGRVPNVDLQASVKHVQRAHEKGEADYLTVLTAQRTLIRANLAYLNALREARKNEVEVRGQLLTGSLRPQQ